MPSYRLSASVRITGYRRSVCRPGSSRIDSVRGGRTRDSIIGEATFRSQSASHLNFPPKPRSNSIFVPCSRLERVARANPPGHNKLQTNTVHGPVTLHRLRLRLRLIYTALTTVNLRAFGAITANYVYIVATDSTSYWYDLYDLYFLFV